MRGAAYTAALAAGLLGVAAAAGGCGVTLTGVGIAGYGAVTGSSGGDQARPPAVAVQKPARSASGTVTVSFTLFDPDGDPADVAVEVSRSGGAFAPALAAAASPPLRGLAASAGGVAHAFVWDYAAQLGAGASSVVLRLTPAGAGGAGLPATIEPFLVGNDPPVLDGPVSVQGAAGNVVVRFALSDSTSDLARVAPSYSTAGPAGPFSPITAIVGGATENLPAAPTAVAFNFTWDTRAELGPRRFEAVVVALAPSDGFAAGDARSSAPFAVDNNTRPRAIVTELATNPDRMGGVVVDLTLIDAESDPVDILLQWRLSGESFPALGPELDDPAARARALLDPTTRTALHLLAERPVPLEGALGSSPDPRLELRVPSPLAGGLLRPGLAGKAIEVLRDRRLLPLGGPLPGAGPIALEPGTRTALVALAAPAGRLERVDLASGAVVGTVAVGLVAPAQIALLPDGRGALVADPGRGELLRVDRGLAGQVPEPVTALAGPRGVAALSAGEALVTDEGPGAAAGDVLHVDLASGAATRIATGLAGPRAIVLAPDRRAAYIAERDGGRILELDLLTRAARPIATAAAGGPAAPLGLALRPGGASLLVTTDTTPARLHEVDLGTGATGLPATLPVGAPAAAAAPDGALYAIETTDAGTGAARLLAAGGVAASATIAAADSSPARFLVTPALPEAPTTGARFRIPRGRNEGGGALGAVAGLASSPAGVRHRFVWDTRVDAPQAPLDIGVTPFDGARGALDFTQIPRTFERFGAAPRLVLGPGASMDGPLALAAADLDGDGRLDLVVASEFSDNVVVFLQDAGGAFPAAPTFDLAPASAAVMDAPAAVAVADLDGDGRPDIATANRASGNLTIFLQTPARTFASTPSVNLDPDDPAVMGEPVALAAADLDADGRLDLVSANQASDGVAVFLQGAGGGFSATPTAVLAPGDPSVLDQPVALAVGDVDGDGRLDLATANAASDSVTVFRGTPAGLTLSATLKSGPAVMDGPLAVALGDVDGDGLLDLAVACRSTANVLVFFRRADVSAGPYPAAPDVERAPGPGILDVPRSLALRDLDRDGDLDVACADEIANALVVFTQTAPRAFDAQPSVHLAAAAARFVLPADLDGDGDLDLVCASADTDRVLVHFQAGPGGFDPAPVADLSVSAEDLAVGDADGDGGLDLVVSRTPDPSVNEVRTFLHGAPGSYLAPRAERLATVIYDADVVEAADIDGDGRLDVVIGSQREPSPPAGAFKATVILQGPGGTFAGGRATDLLPALDPTVVGTVGGIALGDLDGDGRVDVVTANTDANDLTVFLQRAGPLLFEPTPTARIAPGAGVTGAPAGVALGDLDRDGRLDVVSTNSASDNVTVFLQAPGGGFPSTPSFDLRPGSTSVMDEPTGLAVADIDGDGRLDIVTANRSNNLTVFLQSSAGAFSSTPSVNVKPDDPAVMNRAVGVAAGDVDGDGRLDLACCSRNSDNITIFRQVAPGVFRNRPDANLAPGASVVDNPRRVVLADFDGDGDMDVVSRNSASENLTIFSVNRP